MAAAPPAAPGDGPLANPSSSSPSPSPSILLPYAPNPVFDSKVPDKIDKPIPEHLLHHGVGRMAGLGEGIHMGMDGVGRVGGQEGVDGGYPQMGVDGGGDRHMGTDGGRGGTRQRCKNRRQKHNGGSLVPNTTKVTNCFLVSRYCIVWKIIAIFALLCFQEQRILLFLVCKSMWKLE
jgi:hypothetical protein